MSWQQYIDQHLTAPDARGLQKVLAGCIFGLDASFTPWAGTPGWNVTPEEAAHMLRCFQERDVGPQYGIYAFGVKFMFITREEENDEAFLLVGKQGQNGLVCYKTARCVIVGYHDHSSTTANCRDSVEKLGKYFRDIGY
eukprot:tig00021434_g21316.t1